jgi:hypothetical protein
MLIARLSSLSAPLVIPIAEWFFPYVQNWLEAAEKKTSEWVQSAIKADKVPFGTQIN